MSYCGYVVKVEKLRPHSNADRLQVATFFGNDTIVDLRTHVGDMGVYFPSDGQLSEKYCQINDLVRRKDENGNPAGGYMDPDKRNVKAIKLRGEKSDGLYMPLTSLMEFCTISDLKVGDKIDVLNGEEICRKYIPRSNGGYARKSRGYRKPKQNICPTFFEHVETEQLAYNLDKFYPGDVVQLTLKMHGCFAYDTRVRMANGKQKRIQNIKVGDKVLGYNFETKKFEEATVLNTFKNAPSKEWRAVKISRTHLLGDKRGDGFKCTPNHPFWSEEYQCWIEAEDLKPGMEISCLFPSVVLTDRQKEIMVGNYLGDGCLQQFDMKTAEIQSSSKVKEYSNFMTKITSGLYQSASKEYVSGYGTTMFRTRSARSADMFNFFDQYVTWDKEKDANKLKDNFAECVTPLSLAIMYMDDGSLAHNESQEDRAYFAICDYNEHDSKIVCDCFKKFNIEPVYYKDSKGFSRIRLNTDEAYKFFNLIKQYIPECMRYKLPADIEWHDLTDEVFKEEELVSSYVFSKQVVESNEPIHAERGWIEYDLETSLHNYVVGYSLVHNTSGRTGYLPVRKTRRTWIDKLFRRHGKDYFEYDYVTGTRRVVLDNSETREGYYDSDEWRFAMTEKFIGKLNKNETVYYEIVGFQGPNGAPIMAQCSNAKVKDKEFSKMYGDTTTFSYSCEQEGGYEWEYFGDILHDPEYVAPCCEVYVYRMTMVNEDGDVVEYSPAQIKTRCEQMGVNTVMEFETFQIPPFVRDEDGVTIPVVAGDYVTRKVEQYYDGPDPIGKTHVREGVVARILNRPKFEVYKHKNMSFKILEGIIKEEATAPDIEEAQDVEEGLEDGTIDEV